ncbi:MAG: hypothetical protein E7419_03960 [Ruminococcaceae bacterium]|nr:hypothetical protein [Oscillospiraceae bacterium]
MEKVICCPNCKSEDLKFPENKYDYIVCNDCEYEFYSVETLTEEIERKEKVFSVTTYIQIISLIIGTFALALSVFIDFELKLIPQFLIKYEYSAFISIIVGFVMYSVSLITFFILLKQRNEINVIRNMRRHLKKRIYKEKR